MSPITKNKCNAPEYSPPPLMISYGIMNLDDHLFRNGLVPAQYQAVT